MRDLREVQAVERANLAFGQGMSVTVVQQAAAAAVIANGGRRVQPRIALRLERDDEISTLGGPAGERVLSTRTTEAVLAMMQQVVESGTGRGAALPRHQVAGKTGTAQKVVDGRYSQHHYVASFVGIVPVRHPRLVVVVVLDEPRLGVHTGGQAAAPVFREVAEFAVQQLGIPPEAT